MQQSLAGAQEIIFYYYIYCFCINYIFLLAEIGFYATCIQYEIDTLFFILKFAFFATASVAQDKAESKKAAEAAARKKTAEEEPPKAGPTSAPPTTESAPKEEKDDTVLKTDPEKTGYAIGRRIGTSFQRDSIEIDWNAFKAGLDAGLAQKISALTPEEEQKIQDNLRKHAMEAQRKRAEDQRKQDEGLAKKNLDAEKLFLEKNGQREGVVTTKSGLQYEIITRGEGELPKLTDAVSASYRGTTIGGAVFDQSPEGQPRAFPLQGVIKGWTEALQLMPVGSKWKLYIPSNLAYGPRRRSPVIGPNQTLIFDIELVSIKEPVRKEAKKAAVKSKAVPVRKEAKK